MNAKINRIIILLQQNNLEKADLAGEKLNINNLSQLSDVIKKNTRLQALILGGIVVGCNIEDEGVGYIAAMLKEDTTLNYLNLRSNSITDKGCQILSDSLKNNNSLNYLDLRSNPITDYGKQILTQALLKKNIEILFDE